MLRGHYPRQKMVSAPLDMIHAIEAYRTATNTVSSGSDYILPKSGTIYINPRPLPTSKSSWTFIQKILRTTGRAPPKCGSPLFDITRYDYPSPNMKPLPELRPFDIVASYPTLLFFQLANPRDPKEDPVVVGQRAAPGGQALCVRRGRLIPI